MVTITFLFLWNRSPALPSCKELRSKTASVTWACSKRCLHCKREVGRGIFPREPTDFFRKIPCDFILGHAPDNLAARHLNSVGGVAYKAIAGCLTEKSRGISWKYSVDNFTGLAQRGVAMNPTDSRDFRKCIGALRTRERIMHWTQEVIANIARDACGIRTMSSPRVKLMSSLVFNPRFFSPCRCEHFRTAGREDDVRKSVIGRANRH